MEIITDSNGKPGAYRLTPDSPWVYRPTTYGVSRIQFIRELHEFNQAIADAANQAFDEAFRKAIR